MQNNHQLNILLGNDDGIEAKGLIALAGELAQIANVYVAAPTNQQSGASHGISVGRPLGFRQVDLVGSCQKAWAIDGTPADCIKVALEELLADVKIDLVVSGINAGPNLGTDVFYSGTVASAFEGYVLGIPALAVSLAYHGEACDYQNPATICSKFIKWWQGQGFNPHTLFNLNFPGNGLEAYDGKIKFTTLGKRLYRDVFTIGGSNDQPHFVMGGTIFDDLSQGTTDVFWANQGYITLTPLGDDLTNYQAYKAVANLDIAGEIF